MPTGPSTLADLLTASAERHPERPALTDVAAGRVATYAELAANAAAIAARLRAAGVGAPQRIGLAGANSPAYVAAAFGLLATGACLVPIAPNVRSAERAAIVDAIDVNGVVEVAADGGAGAADWSFDWIDRTRRPPAGFAELDPAFIRFSSGTTADAKGVVLSHRATLARIAAADAVLRLGPDDRVLWTLPLAYHFAVTIPAYVGAGVHVLLTAEARPAALAAALAAERATIVYAAPLQIARLAAVPGAPRSPALRLALATAAPLPVDVAARFEAAFGHPLGQAYGIIEAGLPCINTRRGVDAALPSTAVGRAVPGYEVAIVADDGTVAARGTHGDVVLRGPGLFDAYYAPWTPCSATLRDGWFPTGDVGSLDADGVLTLHGRRKSTIVVAGLKVFPEEIEDVLNGFPAIAESRAFAATHARLGELPHADVVLRSGAPLDRDALARHLAERLSPWKVPVEIRVVEAIPKTGGGKISRR